MRGKTGFTSAAATLAVILVTQPVGAESPPPTTDTETSSWESFIVRAERQYLLVRPGETRDLLLAVQREAGRIPANDLGRARLSLFLGSGYHDLGDNRTAVPLLEDSRRIWEAAGAEELRYLRTLNLLASALLGVDRSADAWRTLQHALRTARKVLGPRHHVVGALLTTSASFHLRQGEVVQAKRALVEAEELLRTGASSPPRALATALRGLGSVHLLQGQMGPAGRFFTEAEVISRALGKDSLPYAAALSNLGNFLVADANPARAQPVLTKALHIYETRLGAECADAAPVLAGLAAVAITDRKFLLAAQYLDRALETARRAYGPDSTQVAEVEYMTGWLLVKEGKPRQAQSLLEHANAMFRRVYGEAHYKVADSFLMLGEIYAGQNRPAEAESAYQRSIARFEQALGDRHVKLAEAIQQYAKVLKRTDKAGARILEQRSRTILAANKTGSPDKH